LLEPLMLWNVVPVLSSLIICNWLLAKNSSNNLAGRWLGITIHCYNILAPLVNFKIFSKHLMLFSTDSLYVCMCVCVCVCVCVCMCVCTYACTYVRAYVVMCACTHTHICTQICYSAHMEQVIMTCTAGCSDYKNVLLQSNHRYKCFCQYCSLTFADNSSTTNSTELFKSMEHKHIPRNIPSVKYLRPE
jgi:hypothetical protein